MGKQAARTERDQFITGIQRLELRQGELTRSGTSRLNGMNGIRQLCLSG